MVDTEQVEKERRYLLKHFGRNAKFERYPRSRINGTWSVCTQTVECIVRFYPPFFREKFVVETNILRMLERCNQATPRLLKVDTSGFETPVLFLSKLPGLPIADCTKVINSCSLIQHLQEFMMNVSTIPVNAIGYLHHPASSASISQFTEEAIHEYLARIADAAILSTNEICRLEVTLSKLPILLAQKEAQLTYPDLSSGNILVKEGRLSGLVDWEFVMGFDPLYGFANLLLEQNTMPEIRWISTAELLSCFTQEQKDELLLLALLRAAELLSYLDSTVIFSPSTKQTMLEGYTHSIKDFTYLVDHQSTR